MKPIYKKKEDHRGSSFPYYSALPLIVSYGYRDCDLLMTLSRLSTMNSGTVPNLKQKKRQLAKASTTGFNSQKKRKTRSEPDDNVSRENGRRRISGCRSFANRVKSEPPRWIDSRWFDPFGRENRENPKRWPAGVAALSLDLAFIDRS